MFDRILVPLDGYPEAEGLLKWLRAWDPASKLLLFHCVPARLPKGEPAGYSRFETVQEAGTYLETVARSTPGPSEVIVRSGSPADRIVTAALQAEAGLVVLGCGGENGAPRLLGKIHEIVARTCPLPVMMVSTPPHPSCRRLRRILAPLDAGSPGEDSMDVLRSVARDLAAEVILLHVGSPDSDASGPESNEYSDLQLNLIRRVWTFLKDGIAARTIMTKGSVVEEVVAHERSLDVDLIAVPKERPGGRPWQALAARCGRPVLLYEPREAPSIVVPPTARVALVAPRG
jgi:nucleotide-binding universal stress UspA family protein